MNNWQRWKGIMKAYPFEEKRLAKWRPPYIVQPKYDGVRCRAIFLESGDWLLLSSEENPIFSVPHINKSLKNTQVTSELDGELYCHGMNLGEITSITSRTVNIHPDHKLMQFHIFDLVDEARDQMSRLYALHHIDNLNLEPLRISPVWYCESLEDVMRAYDNILDSGYEGIIVRNLHAPYERKRSVWLMKFKPKKEDEYEIIGWQEEVSKDGIPKDRLGSLSCDSGDGNDFSVGTGFSDEARQILWDKREELIGRTAKVQYQHLTSKKKTPRFPVFVEVI